MSYKKLLVLITSAVIVLGFGGMAMALPTSTSHMSLLPFNNNEFYLGTSTGSTKFWKGVNAFDISSLGTVMVGTTSTTTIRGNATSTFAGLSASGGLRMTTLTSCDSLDTDSSGNIICGSDTGGAFPFTVTGYGVSTSTTVGFTNGVLSAASSTFTSDLRLSSLSAGGLGIGTGGLLYSAATTTFSGGVAYSAGNVTNTLTAGDGLTRNTDDFDCDTASGSVFGCLSSADWTTFNNSADFAYLFPSNATTTGLGLYASTTIGATTQATGLTISGGATTTGNIRVEGTGTSTYSGRNYLNYTANDGGVPQFIRLDSQAAVQHALYAENFTNWAHTGDLVRFRFRNTSDTGDLMSLMNAGSGDYIDADGNFRVLKAGGILARATSTIGSGTQAGGLTIFGGATTTGSLRVEGSSTSTFANSGLSALALDTTGGTATSTMRGLRLTSNGLQVSTLVSCSEALETDASGNVICGTDATGSGGGSDFTFQTHFGAITAATSSPTLFTGALHASSTVRFGNGTVNFIYDGTTGKIGVGTTTPWAAFSIASSTMTNGNYSTPLFVISTSTSSFGRLVEVYATSTTLIQRGANGTHDSGVRFIIGGMDGGHFGMKNSYLDQLEVNGRINTMEWADAVCSAANLSALSTGSDANNICGVWGFGEETNGTFTAGTSVNGVPVAALRLAVAATSDGAGLFWGSGPSAGGLSLSTTTPVLETVARIANAEATTTIYTIGFPNKTANSSTLEAEATAGCFFLATSTTPNWLAVCRTALTTSTQVDTGFASSTILTGSGSFYRFRVEADNTHARFFMGSPTASMGLVADISTNYPAQNALAAALIVGRTNATLANGLDIVNAAAWARVNTLPQ